MTIRQDIAAMVADYRGLLHWNAVSGYVNGSIVNYPAIDIPLYIKEMSVPIRQPKITEVATVPTIDPNSGFDLKAEGVFWGGPDPLTLTLTGWIITPVTNKVYTPVDATGSLLNIGNMSYGEIISAYLEGRMAQNQQDAVQRTDPAYFLTPHGQKYVSPHISIWDTSFTVNMKKETFSMTLILEY